MSLYHETADVLSAPESAGSLKSRIFGRKDFKTSHQQVYALAQETCKWSAVLKEVIDNAEILRHERKLTPVLALLLVHDFLVAKGGIALPVSHGLRASIERHKARLAAEFTRAKLRRKASSIDVLRQQVEAEHAAVSSVYPRWVRVNVLLTSFEDQLDSTFKGFNRVYDIEEVISARSKSIYVDEHVPNLLAVSPSFEIIKTEAYKSGALILQDKASCFPAYLLDPLPQDGDVIDSCAAPGNKTTHLAAIIHSRANESESNPPRIFAFEKDKRRAKTLEKMVNLAGAKDTVSISFGQDFLKVIPKATLFKDVGCMLLDPSCSGSGIVGRDALPIIHLPGSGDSAPRKSGKDASRKRKRPTEDDKDGKIQVIIDDDGQQTVVSSEQELAARLEALSTFQLTLLLHAFNFPSARKITYSTCSIHDEENEQVVIKALQSNVAKTRGWHILNREKQVRGMREWPVRGSVQAANGDKTIADACIRSCKDDGRGVMGFFVAAFVRDVEQYAADDHGPYLRDEQGLIVRNTLGMPLPKENQTSEVDEQSGDYVPVSAENDDEDVSGLDSSSGASNGAGETASEDEWDGFSN